MPLPGIDWVRLYRSKVTTPDDAVGLIQSGHRVYISGNAATPHVLLEALARRAPELEGVEVLHVLMLGESSLSRPEVAGHVRLNAFFVGPGDREAVNAGRADYIPILLHEIPKVLRGELAPDVVLLQTSPPDEHGFLSLGTEVLANLAAVSQAKHVIVHVNERMPRTLGNSFIHLSRVSRIVELPWDLPELDPRPIAEVEARIGRYIAELIPDGATLQVGIGGIPDAVLSALRNHRDLGIHSEMISDGVMDLVEAGVITGARKTLHPGKVVATFVLGSRRLYDFVDNNPLFELHPVDYTNDPFVIAQNRRMVAVNSALEVDLTGQVCADSLGTFIYSGFGGQLDFIRGAARSEGGIPIIALPSTAKGGTVSRIVPTLTPGAGVVTTRADVHYVVTEHGVADLHGKSLRQRARALIAIADPKFRPWLEEEARKRHLL